MEYATFTYLDGPLKGRTAPLLTVAQLDEIAARGVELHKAAFRAKGSTTLERFEGFYRIDRRDIPPPAESLPKGAPVPLAFEFVAVHVPGYVAPAAPQAAPAVAPEVEKEKEGNKPFRVEVKDGDPLAETMKRLAVLSAPNPSADTEPTPAADGQS